MNINTSPISRTPLNQWWEITPGEKFAVRASMQDMGGLCTIIEMTVDPRNAVPLHTHANEEEHFIVLEGTFQMVIGGESRVLSAGESVTVTKGTPHTWANLSDALVRVLIIFTPGNMEETFRLIGSSDGSNLAEIAEMAKNGGSEMVGPPPFENVYSVMSPRPKS